MSGKIVLGVVLFLIPVGLVGLLLSGRAETHYLNFRDLTTREEVVFRIGSFEVGEKAVTVVDEWPEFPADRAFLTQFGEWPDMTPAEYFVAIYPEESEPVWASTYRAMPFAFVIPVENLHVMTRGKLDILSVRLTAARLLDPTNDDDRAAWRALDEELLAELKGERIEGRVDRSRGPRLQTTSELFAQELLDELAEATGDGEAVRLLIQ